MATFIVGGTRRPLGAQGVFEPFVELFRAPGRTPKKGFSLKLQDLFRARQQDRWQDVLILDVYTIDEALALKPVCEAEARAKSLAKAHVESLAPKPPRPRGFAAMTAEQRSAAGRKGGKNVPAAKRSFARDPQAARRAGSKGGSVPYGKRKRKPKTLDPAPN